MIGHFYEYRVLCEEVRLKSWDCPYLPNGDTHIRHDVVTSFDL